MANDSSSSLDVAPHQFAGGTDLSSLCSLLVQPRLMTGLFRDFLSRHFASADTIEIPELKARVWNPTETTAILIESFHRWRPETTELRPAIIIKRNAYQYQRRGFGDKLQGPPVDAEGSSHYARFFLGSHTLFCIGSNGAQAELLGAEVENELGGFAPVLLKDLDLKRLEVTQVGEIAELDEARENFVVPVTMGYAGERKWVVWQQAPRIAGISLTLLLDC